jgi:hypothetical protein
MRTWPAVLASACLCGFATTASAQNMNEMMNRLERMMHSTAAAAAEREWNKLPKDELTCATQKLTERGDSVQSLARRGILPSDPSVAEIRTQCTASKAEPSAAPPSTRTRPIPEEAKPASENQQPDLNQQTDLAAAESKIAELEGANAAAEFKLKQAEQARLAAEDAKRKSEQARIADKAEFEAAIAQVVSDKAAADAESVRRERLANAGIIGLLAIVAALTAALFMSRHKAKLVERRVLKQQAVEPESTTVASSAQSQSSKDRETKTSSPEDGVSAVSA